MFQRLLNRLMPAPVHPIDIRYGIDTSGNLPPSRLARGRGLLDSENVGYAGSQPSAINRALTVLRDALEAAGDELPEEFLDLGCGKGRALVVAYGWPFGLRRGIELDPTLVAIARENASIIAGDLDPPYEVEEGDASKPRLSDTDSTVIYLYNSFGDTLVARLLDHLEAHIRTHPDQKLWLVLYNPVRAGLIDARPQSFERFFAEKVPFTEEESSAHPFSNRADSVVIWQSKTGTMIPPIPGHDREVLITIPGLGADVQ